MEHNDDSAAGADAASSQPCMAAACIAGTALWSYSILLHTPKEPENRIKMSVTRVEIIQYIVCNKNGHDVYITNIVCASYDW